MRQRLLTAILLLLLHQQAAPAMTVYHIGNSHTHGLNLPQLSTWADLRGHSYVAGRHVNEGAKLDQVWQSPTVGQYTIAPYGAWGNALDNYAWDAITLEPYLDSLMTAENRVEDFASYASGQPEVFVFQVWPWKSWGDYATNFDAAYDPSVLNSAWLGRDYYNRLMSDVDARLIPTGEVLYELDRRIKAGSVPGIESISELYAVDGCNCHLNVVGNFALLSTVYATLFAEAPLGLPVTSGVDPAVGEIIQRAAWQVVAGHRYSGVAATGDFDGDGSITVSDYERWKTNFSRGISDAGGYTAWRDKMGTAGGESASVPEPSTLLILLATGLVALLAAPGAWQYSPRGR